MGSSANESAQREAARVREIFQTVDCPHGGQESKAHTSIRNWALGTRKRVCTRPVDESVQGVRTMFCHDTGR
jgi:hypothetical protein